MAETKMLPTPKEMFFDSIELYVRWMLIILSFVVVWVKLSELLDTFIGVP